MISGPRTPFRQFEKKLYVLGIPALLGVGLFTIYNKQVLQAEHRAARIKEVEERFLSENPENMIKL